MNLKDIGSLSLDDLTKVLADAKSMINSKLGELSASDKIKVDNIVKGVDTTNLKDLEIKIEELNTKQNA
jgi:TATA-box binding protein (TBP) (component of TFIID and TFIIIB)